MKKLFFTLLFLFFIYFALQALFYFFGPGHNTTYKVNDFEVKEEYINKQENEHQAYIFTISDGDAKFYFQVFKNYENQSKIIKEIKSYKNNTFNCIMPIFIDDEVLTDLMCLNENTIYNYKSLDNPDEELKNFYDSLKKYIPEDDLSRKDNANIFTLYPNNMQPNYYVSFASYKGFVYANPTNMVLNTKNIFENDVYDSYLSGYVDKYYVTVDYSEQYGYSKIYIYNITTGKEEVVTLSRNIEKNSYIQGVYKKSLYIFDRSNKIQYEINAENSKVLEVGNTASGVTLYKNGTSEHVSAYDCAIKDLTFAEEIKEENGYKVVSSTIGSKTGYTYYAKKNGEKYKIYRVNNSNKDQYTYLFDTKYLDKIITVNEYIYYVDEENIKYYSDSTGIRTLATNDELNFNQKIKYQIFYQK